VSGVVAFADPAALLVSEARPVELVEVLGVAPRDAVVSTAESAECTCPEFCERDHDVD
jgi:hypothetical protein